MKKNESFVKDLPDYIFEQEVMGIFDDMDEETFDHCMSMGKIAARITKAVVGAIPYKFSKSELDYVQETGENRLSFVFAMHDIGKVVDDIQKVISKPTGLDPEDWLVIEKHPQCGAAIIYEYFTTRGLDSAYPRDMINAIGIAVSHHMLGDGTGYPPRKASSEVGGLTKIATLADNIDAISAKRVYKPAHTNDEVRAAIQAKPAKQFDDEIKHIVLGMWHVIEGFLDSRGVTRTTRALRDYGMKRQFPVAFQDYDFVAGLQERKLVG